MPTAQQQLQLTAYPLMMYFDQFGKSYFGEVNGQPFFTPPLGNGQLQPQIVVAPTVAGGVANAAADTFSIQTAAQNLSSSGGGIVQLPAATIYLTSPLLFYNGVVYVGSGFNYNNTNQIAPANPSVQGTQGTVLVCGTGPGLGTFPCFWDGKSDRVSQYATSTLMTAQYIMGCGVKNVQIVNASYGIKCGGYLEASVAWSVFEHVSSVGCGWGHYFENADSCTFRDLCDANYTVGAQWHMSSGGTLINLGDSLLDRIVYAGGPNTTYLSRQIVIGARGASSNNGMAVHNIGGVGGGSAANVSNTISIPASGTSVTLTTGTTAQYAVGMPVTVSVTTTSAPILNAQQIYFIQSIIDGTHFTLSNNAFAASAITWTGAQAGVTMITKGFPGLELVGYDTSNITGFTCLNVGCESAGSMAYLIQGCGAGGGPADIKLLNGLTAPVGLSGGAQQHYHNAVCRNNNLGLNLSLLAPPNAVDFDSSMAALYVSGYQSGFYQQGYTGTGFSSGNNSTFPSGLFLQGFNGTKTNPPPDIYADTVNGLTRFGQIQVPGTTSNPFGVNANANATMFVQATAGPIYCGGGSGEAYQINLTPSTSKQLGISFLLCNTSGTAQTANTTVTGGSLNFIGVVPGTTTAIKATSMTIPINTCVRITSAIDSSGTYFWAIG